MTKAAPPTLADALLQIYGKPNDFDPKAIFAHQLASARRFVLDDRMSEFSADLAYAALPKYRDAKRDHDFLEGRRILARLPHALTWIEFNMRARHDRVRNEYGGITPTKDFGSPGPARCGWLIAQHPDIDTAFMATECVSHTIDSTASTRNKNVLKEVPSPALFSWVWRTDEGPLPWPVITEPVRYGSGGWRIPVSGVLTGIATYNTTQLGAMVSPWLEPRFHPLVMAEEFQDAMDELSSDMRYLWALLAAINDTPVTYRTHRPSGKVLLNGRMRPYLDHTVITLNVPGHTSLRKLARKVSVLSRRRAHQVRGHWRKDWRHPDKKIWVHEHQRGDASVGFVTHDYEVKHEEEHHD